MLTLQNFEQQVNPTILERGKQYYKQLAVIWLEESEENVWEAEVEGTEPYEVSVTLADSGEITSFACNCPYDGDMCKHIVAVLLTLQDTFRKKEKKGSKTRQKKVKNDSMEHLLQATTLEELQHFLRHYAAIHKDFKTDFELHFADKDDRIDVAEKYKELFKKLLRKYSDRGYIDYRTSFRFTNEMDQQLGHAQDLVTRHNFRDAFALATAALEVMMEAVQYSDDSAGNIGSTLYSIGELLDQIAHAGRAALELKEQLLAYLEKALKDRVYFEFGDIGYMLFDIYHDLALQLSKTDTYLHFIDTLIAGSAGPYNDYDKEFFLQHKMAFLEAIGRKQEAADLIWENIDVVGIRQSQVAKALQNKDYEAAKSLIKEGIRVAESKDHPGTVHQWETQLLELAVLEKDIPTIRLYTRQFAFSNWFHRDYYKQWKATYPAEEWQAVIENYIQETIEEITRNWKKQKNNYWRPDYPPLLEKLAPIYTQEQYWDRLLELVQKENKLGTTLGYHAYLAKRFPTEYLALYLPAFEQYGQEANGRSEYATLARYMKKAMQDIPQGKEQIQHIARSLMAQFPRRPAMQEELRKVL
ncbi:SWIM zinc finger family protein [Pontibacter mangrovi]|nr:SWIM zinc finger family protein [Pontibacter mangrovi]